MADKHITDAPIRSARAEDEARTRSRLQGCILLAVVTSEDVAASLIDRAIALNSRLDAPRPDALA